MARKKSTTKQPWDSTPKRGSRTRYVKRTKDAVFAHSLLEKAIVGGIAVSDDELPPPGPSNIMVTTASPLPAPKKIGSRKR